MFAILFSEAHVRVADVIYTATSGGLSVSADGGDTFTNKTTAHGLGDDCVRGVYAAGSTVYAATNGGLSVSIDGGNTFINKTTAHGLGDDRVRGVYAAGSTVYAATNGGLSVSADGGSSFTNKTTAHGLGHDHMCGVYAVPPAPPSEDIPDIPTGLTGTVISATQVRLTWRDSNDNEDGFRIERTDSMSPWITVTMTGANATALSALRFSAASDNPDLVPAENIRFGGTGETRTVTLTPVKGMSGTANVTVSVSDGSTTAETDFALNVTTGPELSAEARLESDGGDTVAPGGVLRYTAAISNTGDRAAEGVRFALPLPGNTEYSADTAGAVIRSALRTISEKASDPVYDGELNQLEWTGDIAMDESAEISFDLRVRPGTASGEAVSFGGTVAYDTDGDGISDITRNTGGIGDGSADSEVRITVEGCLPGDTDADGIIDMKDAVRVMRTLSGTDIGKICPESDANGDEKTGPEELIYILKKLAK
ncbi:DUF11 domain-containing protein [Desulfonema magnum]|nr:DUF11 domain-containing protein [Desulfonema magnum]